MIRFWTGAESSTAYSVVEAAMASIDASAPHEFVPYKPSWLPTPKSDSVIVAMGTKTLDVMKAYGLVQKNRTLTSLRGKVIPGPTKAGGKVGAGAYILSYDPGITLQDPEKNDDIVWDVKLAHRWVTTGSLKPKVGNYTEVEDFDAVVKYVEWAYEQTGSPVEVAMDLETVGLYPWYPDVWIVSISFTVAPGVADIKYFGSQLAAGVTYSVLFTQIAWLLTTDKVSLRGANLKFDLVWIEEKWGIECSNFRFDTLLVGSLLNENRSNSLNWHAKLFTDLGGYDDEFNGKYDKGAMHKVPKADLLAYAGGDTDATYRSATVLKNQLLSDKKLSRFYVKILHPAARAFEKIERRGVLVDLSAYKMLEQDLTVAIDVLHTKLLNSLPRRIRVKYEDKIDEKLENEKSPFTQALLKDFLFSKMGLNLTPKEYTPKTEEPSTSKKHLQQFLYDPDAKAFIEPFIELNATSKALSTYVHGFMEHLRPDSRFHPTYALFRGKLFGEETESGARTGRTSVKDPAFQTLPKHTKWAKRLRQCFPAPDGYVFWQIDYNQGELRLTACAANEPIMLKVYADGGDLHAVTAARLNGYSLDEFYALKESNRELFDKLRQGGKAGNFGLVYGMSAGGFMIYARDTYGVILTLKEATAARDAFFETYSMLPTWHAVSVATARNAGQIRTPFGRIRHLSLIRSKDGFVRAEAERQSVNSPIQGQLSDMTLWAIALFEEQYAANEKDMQIIGMTHDSIYGYVLKDKVDVWMPRIKAVMEDLPYETVFGWKPQLKFTTDIELGPTFGDLIKFAA